VIKTVGYRIIPANCSDGTKRHLVASVHEDRRQETEYRKQEKETGDRIQETGDGMQAVPPRDFS
jgi:hypothetical protein